jgi:Flp pilus assembly protein TadG
MAMENRRSSEHGAELIEFAFVLPLLLAIVAGIVDFGFMFERHLVLQNAAREGARLRALPLYTNGEAEARALEYVREGLSMTAAEVADSVVAVVTTEPRDPDPTDGKPGFTVAISTVTMTHTYLILGPIMGLLGAGPDDFGDITLTARSVMRCES